MAEPESLSWEAPPFIIYEKGKYWRLSIVLTGLFAGLFLLLLKLYIPAFVLALGGVALVMQSTEKAYPLHVELTRTGVRFGHHTYLYNQLKHFTIINLEEPTLFIETKQGYLAPHSVVIADYEPLEVQHFLGHYLPEAKDQPDTAFIRLNRLIGFS